MRTKATRPAASAAPGIPAASPPESAADEIILLALTGMSPAVLTETLWALAQPEDGTAPVIPHRVIVLTTVRGRARLAELFAPSTQLGGITPWDALRQSLQHAGHNLTGRLRFGLTGDDIRVITAAEPTTGRSRELPDIRDRFDNEAAADFLLEQVRAIVENPDTQLIVSLAGGRKTMSALLYACMTLAGRATDRLTHVLVSEPYETQREFWFPAQPGGPLPASDHPAAPQTPLLPAAATVILADVPFVPLRNLFQRELGRKAGTFRRLVSECSQTLLRRAAEELRLTLDPARAELEINGQTLKLAPPEMLVALFLAQHAKNQHRPAYGAYKDAVDDLNQFRRELLATPAGPGWCGADSLRETCDDRYLTKAISGIRDKLRRASGPCALLAQCLPEKGRCSLNLPPPLIHIK